MAVNDLIQSHAVADIAFFQRPVAHELTMAAAQIIISDGNKPRRIQRLACMGADIASPTCDQHSRIADSCLHRALTENPLNCDFPLPQLWQSRIAGAIAARPVTTDRQMVRCIVLPGA